MEIVVLVKDQENISLSYGPINFGPDSKQKDWEPLQLQVSALSF